MADSNQNGNVDPEVAGEELSVGGASTNGGSPAIEDLFATRGAPIFNTVRELLTASTKPEEFLPRTVITLQDWKRKKRLLAKRSHVETGRTDMRLVLWYDFIIAPAIDGRAREEAVEVAIGQMARQSMMQMAGGRTLNREEVRNQ